MDALLKEKEKDNVLMNFAVIDGGKASNSGFNTPPSDGDWLTPLEIGTIFLVQEKNNPKNFNLGQFQIADKTERSVFLASNLNGLVKTFVVPTIFCNQYRLYEVLAVVVPEQELEEKKDEVK